MSNTSNAPKMLARKPKQAATPSGVVCRIPAELDAELERFIAGTGLTKKAVMEMALGEWLAAQGAL